MKITTIPYTFNPYSTSSAVFSVLLLYVLFHECHWQKTWNVKLRTDNNEIFIFMQSAATTQSKKTSIIKGLCLFAFK